MQIAIIDIGTNTCNLLIAKYSDTTFSILLQDKEMIRLGDSAIGSNIISQSAINRTLKVLDKHFVSIRKYEIDQIKILCTSAVRTAKNKIDFLELISNYTNIPAKVISGRKEANLIFKGVLLAMNQLYEPSLILDIGGGSNEFIIADGDYTLRVESKPAGMARVLDLFSLSDPIKSDEIELIESFFKKKHNDIFSYAENENVKTLIGCSGAFDTIADIIEDVASGTVTRVKKEITIQQFKETYNLIIQSSLAERKQMKSIDEVRIDLIVPALILINLVVDTISIEKIFQTDYALREGVLYQKIKKLKRVSL